MKNHAVNGGFLVVLGKDERLVGSIKQFCQQQRIASGWITGIGGATRAEIGVYSLATKEYSYRNLEGDLELSNLTGSLSLSNNQPFLHLHATISNGKIAVGGHLKELVVAGTCEIYLSVFDQPLVRQHDEATGLELL